MSDFLVIGASGQVGGFLARELSARGASWTGTHRSYSQPGLLPLDITDAPAVERLLETERPVVVLLPAACTHVDHCEQQPAAAYAVNVAGAANVMRAAAAAGARVVYFSSDYIFDGEAGPYAEDAVPRPLSVYGWHKLLAEHYAATCTEAALIIRTTGVFGPEPQGKNFVARLVASLAAGEQVTVSIDQYATPTYGPELAGAVVDLVAAGTTGVVHVAGQETASRYELALAAARSFGLDASLIRPVTTPELRQPARRPLRAGLKVRRAEALLDRPLPGYREGLERMAGAATVSGPASDWRAG